MLPIANAVQQITSPNPGKYWHLSLKSAWNTSKYGFRYLAENPIHKKLCEEQKVFSVTSTKSKDCSDCGFMSMITIYVQWLTLTITYSQYSNHYYSGTTTTHVHVVQCVICMCAWSVYYKDAINNTISYVINTECLINLQI